MFSNVYQKRVKALLFGFSQRPKDAELKKGLTFLLTGWLTHCSSILTSHLENTDNLLCRKKRVVRAWLLTS